MIYYLFASHAAVGCLVTLALVPNRLTGGGFPRFINGLVLFFLVGALLAGGVLAGQHGAAGISPKVLAGYEIAAVVMAIGVLLQGDHLVARNVLLAMALVAALASFVMDTLWIRVPASGGSAVVVFASFLTAALVAGSVCVAMILGHFYLVIPRLSIRPLNRLCAVFLIALVARLVLAGTAILSSGVPDANSPGTAARFAWQNVAVEEGLIFWPRLLAGLLAPLVLAFMAWRTARIRSTQSATGILYVAVVFTTIGEFLGRFLFLATRIPL